MTGIICAMDLELEGIVALMTNTESKNINGQFFHTGNIGET